MHLLHPYVAAALAVAVSLAAQSQNPDQAAAPASLQFPPDAVLTDHAADGTVWATAATWKAGFAASGTTFVPYLGSTVPSAPATFRLRAVACGGKAVALADAVPQPSDRRVRFERGDVVEFYDLSPQGIEQQFAFAALPERGELRLDLDVATELAAEADGAGWYFRGPHGGIRYGAAVAIDAAGERCAVTCERTAEGLRLVVPAAFVAAASLPLCIDPMIGSSSPFGAGTVELSNTDIAYDHSRGEYFVSYERSYSATDHDVFVARLGSGMNYLGLSTIDSSTQYWGRPRLAGLEAHDQVCVAAEASTGGVSPIVIGLRCLSLGNPPVAQPVVFLSPVVAGDYLQPTIGGDADPTGPGRFLLVYGYRNPVSGDRSLHCIGFTSGFVSIQVQSIQMTGSVEHTPVISKTCGGWSGGGASWAIVYRSEVSGSGLGQLRAAVVDRTSMAMRSFSGTNSLPLGLQTLNLGTQWAVSSPTDQALGRRFLCVERPSNLFQTTTPLLGHLFDAAGNVLQTNATIASSQTDNRQPAVDCDGIRFGVAYTVRLTATDADLRCATFGMVGNQVVAQDTAVPSYSLDYDAQPAICAARGGAHGLHGLAFVRSSGSNYELRTQAYAGVAAAGGTGTRNTGCGGLTSTASGLPWLGESMTFTLGDTTGLPGFLLGLPTSQPVPACPGCTQGVSGQALLGGQVTLAIPPNAVFVGMALAAQGFRFAPSGAPCLGQVQIGNTHDFVVR
jgi:hypothetical protein